MVANPVKCELGFDFLLEDQVVESQMLMPRQAEKVGGVGAEINLAEITKDKRKFPEDEHLVVTMGQVLQHAQFAWITTAFHAGGNRSPNQCGVAQRA